MEDNVKIIRLKELTSQMEGEMRQSRAELQSYRDQVLPAVAEKEEG